MSVTRISIPSGFRVFTAPVKFIAEPLNAADSRYGYATAAPGFLSTYCNRLEQYLRWVKNAGDQRTASEMTVARRNISMPRP